MKVAVSIPDDVFEEADRIAKRLHRSRSRLYADALEEFLKKHRGTGVREALDTVYGHHAPALDPLLADLQARVLREKW